MRPSSFSSLVRLPLLSFLLQCIPPLALAHLGLDKPDGAAHVLQAAMVADDVLGAEDEEARHADALAPDGGSGDPVAPACMVVVYTDAVLHRAVDALAGRYAGFSVLAWIPESHGLDLVKLDAV